MVDESVSVKSNIVGRIIKARANFLRENNLIPNEIIITPEDYDVLCELYVHVPSSVNLDVAYTQTIFMGMKLKVECIPTTLLRYTCEMTI